MTANFLTLINNALVCKCNYFFTTIFNLYFSEKRRPNTLYQELSYQEGENVPEGDDANDIAGIVLFMGHLFILYTVLISCNKSELFHVQKLFVTFVQFLNEYALC